MTMEFEGSWILEKSDNFEAYLRELGINIVMRKLAFLVVPTVVITTDQDGNWSMEYVYL